MANLKVQVVGETVGEIVEKMKKFIAQMSPTESVESVAKPTSDAAKEMPKKKNVKSASAAEKPAEEPAAPAPVAKAESGITKEDVMKKIQSVSAKLGMMKAKELVSVHGGEAKKIVDIKPEYFEAVAAACDEALAG